MGQITVLENTRPRINSMLKSQISETNNVTRVSVSPTKEKYEGNTHEKAEVPI